jgi:hypothetical protein
LVGLAEKMAGEFRYALIEPFSDIGDGIRKVRHSSNPLIAIRIIRRVAVQVILIRRGLA